MKYEISKELIPQENRKEINDKILYLIDNNLCEKYGITSQDIFNSYTGDGGLHQLNFNDYDSFHRYTEAKKEIENGQFFTPANISKFLIDCLKPSQTELIADLTAGVGVFTNYLPIEQNIYLNEIDLKAVKVMRYLYPNANITNDDIRYYKPEVLFDLIIGNPPFNLKWKINQDEYLSQLYYCFKSYELLKPMGIMALIVPNSFLNDEFIDGNIIKQINEKFNFIVQFNLPSNSFKNVGVSNFETKIMIFQKKSELITDKPYNNEKITINNFTEQEYNYIYNTYIKPLTELQESLRAKLHFESLNNNNTEEEQQFQFKVKKYLFDIRRHPKLIQYYGKCDAYMNKYYTQKMPEGMKYEEWEKIKVTKNKVLSYLKRTLKKQHNIEQDKIQLVKTSYGLKLKGYSQKNKIYLSKYTGTKEMSFNEMVIENNYPFEDKTYYDLFIEKRNQYEQQNQSFKDMQENIQIKNYLNDLIITDYENNEDIKLNDIQKLDTNKILQKNYGLIQWECGCGKSITGIAQMIYRLKNNNINNVFIVAPAIAINNTWDVILKNYKMDYIRINKLKDINNIQQGQIAIITFNLLIRYQRLIKKFIKQHNQNAMLLLDESDNISSPTAKRTKAVLNCFRKVKYKLLTTGTSTRNSISEVITQFELLYNNSINMLSECEYIFTEDRKTKELKESYNNKYLCPIPAYNEGYTLFKRSHIPERITVFGVGKSTQDIYNAEILQRLIDKTIITRTFTEVVGKKIYEIEQEICKFNQAEYNLYIKIVKEFYSMVNNYYQSTGNSRKDGMLLILRQLNLLIKACSIPHTFKEYEGKEIASKFKKVRQLVNKYSDDRVCIGCKFIKSVNSYVQYIKMCFPDRPVFVITGESTTLNKRKSIIEELQKTTNGILICTQQSLSSSMNINFVNKVIITEMQWNDAVMRQFYFRFIRFNSTDLKKVIFITYENSIESNLLQLILCKEKLNLFMKDKVIDDNELWDEYGVDFDILNMLMTREKDEKGKSYISWGKQEII